MFYKNQTQSEKERYKNYLRIAGSLSNLFSENSVPYLYYRTAENIFCQAFNADNLSRSDVSADAKKDKIGIGLKTFLHNNGNTFQKVAEFNAISGILRDKSDEETIQIIAEARNARIHTTTAQYGLNAMIYHCVTREKGVNYLFESAMDQVDLLNLNIQPESRNSIKFTDGIHEYSFNKSKHTLFKRFIYNTPIETIDIEIIENPFDLLSSCFGLDTLRILEHPQKLEAIYLPLYAPSSPSMEPAEKSGLNQWNAGGRSRHSDEVYIPVPVWIHQKFPSFFPDSNDISFDLVLPNGEVLSASMCQQGQKGLMSNPNKALGKWLLRDIFKLPEGELITRKILNIAGIDSAIVEKVSEGKYKIDFASVGQYEKFKVIHR